MQMLQYSAYPVSSKRKKKKGLKNAAIHVGLYILGLMIVVVLGIGFIKCFGLTAVVIDQSMSETLKSEDKVLINRLAYKIGAPARMDVVAMRIGSSKNSPTYIRRVIGIPGDTVKISGGKIYVNSNEVSITFNSEAVKVPGSAENGVTLDDDSYFVLCDDYNNSEDDSRLDSIGTVSRDQIIGRVWFRSSPISRIGTIK